MKKTFIAGCVAATLGIAGFNAYKTIKTAKLSDLALKNIEALADDETGNSNIGITCSSSGSGTCYYVKAEEGLYGACQFDCNFSGDPNDSCNSLFVDFVNFCSMFGSSSGGL